MNRESEPIRLTDTEEIMVMVFTGANELKIEMPKFEFPGQQHLCLHSLRISRGNTILLDSNADDEPTMSRSEAMSSIQKFLEIVLVLGESAAKFIELSISKKTKGEVTIVPTSSLSKKLNPSVKLSGECVLTQDLINWVLEELETKTEVLTSKYLPTIKTPPTRPETAKDSLAD
ncbi:MAG: hypothetical protein HQ402_02760 [Parcubacteria group bacterium]|nr:hypothetical protein [Parcubacteria group bacterium]